MDELDAWSFWSSISMVSERLCMRVEADVMDKEASWVMECAVIVARCLTTQPL